MIGGAGRRRVALAIAVAGSLSALVAVIACRGALGPAEPVDEIRMGWRATAAYNRDLPRGIRLFEGHDPGVPLRAWFVRVAGREPGVATRVVMSSGDDALETVSGIAERVGARVAVNAGYYREDLRPAEHVGLVVVDDRVLWPATPSVIRGGTRYHVARAAIGFGDGGAPSVAWVRSRGDSLFRLPAPPDNRPGEPAPPPPDSGVDWDVRHAVQAGPALVRDGELRVTVDEEAFFDTPIVDVHPRTAACATGGGDLVLLVVDGRQTASRGVYLEELARMLLEIGCVDALNLDGGGSSTLVVDGELVNRPEGGEAERPVMSALAVFER